VNHSQWDCTLEDDGQALRLGMRLVKGLQERDAIAVAQAVKAHGQIRSVEVLHRRSGVRVKALRSLASADAFGSMGLDRQQALWQVRTLRDESLPIFDQADQGDRDGMRQLRSALPTVPPLRKVSHDYSSMGLTLREHPVSFIRSRLTDMGAACNVELKDASRSPQGRAIAVAGIVLVRQRPSTANGIVFMTLEDETGIANLIVRPQVFKRCRKAARHGVVILARGKVERQGDVVHMLVSHLEELDLHQDTIEARSRDFH
jgi:error-prone DNA polymerase